MLRVQLEGVTSCTFDIVEKVISLADTGGIVAIVGNIYINDNAANIWR
jgi:hypothetical protein